MSKYLNYFSSSEKNFILRYESWRSKIFLPISKFLSFFGVKADHLSYIGLLILILFIVFFKTDPVLSVLFLFLHVIIDAFDGPLARHTKQDGDAGAFTDIICDHTGMFVVVSVLTYFRLLDVLPALIYVYLYTIMIVFAIIKNRIKEPMRFIVRTKYYLYLLYGIFVFFDMNFFDEAIWIFIILMTPSVVFGFVSLKKFLYGNKS
jgi:phosphatidylglycerophosphate synthase